MRVLNPAEVLKHLRLGLQFREASLNDAPALIGLESNLVNGGLVTIKLGTQNVIQVVAGLLSVAALHWSSNSG
jgi:hypothetical protein